MKECLEKNFIKVGLDYIRSGQEIESLEDTYDRVQVLKAFLEKECREGRVLLITHSEIMSSIVSSGLCPMKKQLLDC